MSLMKVRYRGASDFRTVPADDPGLKERGIKVSADLMWTPGSYIVIEDMSEAMENWLREEGTFDVSEMNLKDGHDRPIIKASRADDTGRTVIDGTTGQKSVRGEGS